MRRWLVVTLLVLGASAFAATPGKLLIWCDDTRAPVFEEAAKAYTEATGIVVEVVEVPLRGDQGAIHHRCTGGRRSRFHHRAP
jgi:maltose-binding protein MalE